MIVFFLQFFTIVVLIKRNSWQIATGNPPEWSDFVTYSKYSAILSRISYADLSCIIEPTALADLNIFFVQNL